MDFTPELSAFQGVITSADDKHCFSRLTSKGGNEKKIKEKKVIETISKFLWNEKYINENGIIDTMVSKTRKFAMYIVLNAKLQILQEMVELEGVFLVIWSIPPIPQHLMCELLWNLHMEAFVYEIVTYCYPPLALEVAGAFAKNFKYFNPTKCLQKLHKLTSACYLLTCRLNCFEFEKEKLTSILNNSYETLQQLLNYFTSPPNSHKLNTLSKDELYKYKGECLKTMLLLVYECLNYFTQEVTSSCFNDIYKSTYKADCLKESPPTDKVCDCPDETILECLNNSNILLLDIFKEIVMDVSVDIFCAWSEFEEDGKSMQQTIGELCHKVMTKLLNVSSVIDHPVIGMIQQMARAPLDVNDIINSTDVNIIIQKINSNDENRASWIHALVNKEQLCQHIDLISVIDSNLFIFNEKECLKLYHIFTNYSRSNTINRELAKSLAVKVFQYCNVLDKHKLLQEHFNDNQFVDMSEDEEFHNTVTEMFNKFVASSDVDLSEVLNVFLLNPRQVYHKIFTFAKENTQLANTMLKIMELLKDYSNYYYASETEPCMISIMKVILGEPIETEVKRNNLVKFICGLKNYGIIPGTKLLLLIIMPNMHNALLSKDISRIHLQIQLLDEAYTINELLKYRAPMLAMLSQVMEVVRWGNIKEFVSNAPSTLQLTLNFQKSLLETYDIIIPEAEGDWLRKRLMQNNMQPQNRYYFRKLWGDPGITSFFQSISGMEHLFGADRKKLTFWVTQIVTAATQEEWSEVWDNLADYVEDYTLLGIFYDALRMIIKAVDTTRNSATRACLFYCFQNVVYLTRYKFVRDPLTDLQVEGCAICLSMLLIDTNQDDVDEIGSRLMPLFAYFAEKKHLYKIDVPKFFANTHFSALVTRAFNGTMDVSLECK